MFTEQEYRAAKRAATSVAKMNQGYFEHGDVLGAIYEWMVKHVDKVEKWREDKTPGILNTALYRAGLRYALRERQRITGAQPGDIQFYSEGQVEGLLPSVWDYEDWFLTADGPAYIYRPGGNPAEGNNLLAMLVDVSSAVWSLKPDDVEFLAAKYRDGLDWGRVGEMFELTEDGARKRGQRIVRRLITKLGGPPPWFGGPGSRKAMSNAAAQAEVQT